MSVDHRRPDHRAQTLAVLGSVADHDPLGGSRDLPVSSSGLTAAWLLVKRGLGPGAEDPGWGARWWEPLTSHTSMGSLSLVITALHVPSPGSGR